MPQTPIEIMESAYEQAQKSTSDVLLSTLPDDAVQDLRKIVAKAETQKAVLGATMTSIVYKIYNPHQDIRKHQEGMEGGYSARTFDTKFVTPFLKSKFPHFAMAEGAWLTRSLEQPAPYTLDFPGHIRNKELKTAFLKTLDRLETAHGIASNLLIALIGLLVEESAQDDALFNKPLTSGDIPIAKIIDAISQHIRYPYGKGVVGTARLPVLAIYSVYNLIMTDVRRYSGKILAPLESHTSPDSRAKTFEDVDVNNPDNSCFESVEIKHNKPITVDMVGVAYRKIKNTAIDRYYILTTHEPNFNDYEAVMREIEKYKMTHPCQIIVNGVIPSLKYYMRLMSNPQDMIDVYTQQLEFEYQRASGIKREHLRVWQEIRRSVLGME